jgi:hypothetical protein
MNIVSWWMGAQVALACGPWLDDPRLSWVAGEMLDTPAGHLHEEVQALVERLPAVPGAVPRPIERCEGEEMDLRAALAGHPDAEEIVWRWLAARCGEDLLEIEEVLDEVPLEFRLYAEGAELLAADEDGTLARARWEELLTLPAEQRHWRSTWAASMIAVTRGDRPPDLARVRQLAVEGHADTLGLALASLRQEARGHRGTDRPDLVVASCMAYRASGGRADEGCTRWLPGQVERIFSLDDEGLQRAASDPVVAEVVAIWLTSRSPREEGLPDWTRRWLLAAERAGQRAGAERLGWAAWRQGDFVQAERWAARTDGTSALGRWLQAKLWLRRGELVEAISELEGAARLFGMESSLPFQGHPALSCAHGEGAGRAVAVELGVALVAADRYEEALRSFLVAGDWLDSAWVAERLLTTGELRAFVDRYFPQPAEQAIPRSELSSLFLDPDEASAALRHLLARRLAREGHWSLAQPYFPGDLQPIAASVREAIAQGHNLGRPEAERGEALWRAAFAVKQHGWELLATEMEPDFRVEGGWFELRDTTQERRAASAPGGTLAPSQAELVRLSELAGPSQRYHFVWTAWELAHEAVMLLPDQNESLAQAACTAGNWMATRDVQRSWTMWEVLLRRAQGTEIREGLRGRSQWWGLDEHGLCVPPLRSVTAGSHGGGWGLLGFVGLVVVWRMHRRRL